MREEKAERMRTVEMKKRALNEKGARKKMQQRITQESRLG